MIEMLISVLILSVGLVIMMQAFQATALALAESRDAIRASMLLREKLTEESHSVEDAREEGRFSAPYNAYRWSVHSDDALVGDHQMRIVTAGVWLEGSPARHELIALRAGN